MSITQAPFGTYATPTAMPTNERVVLTASLTSLKNLIPDPTADPGIATTYAPDFDRISPDVAKKIRAEIAAIIVGINCTAVLTSTGNL